MQVLQILKANIERGSHSGRGATLHIDVRSTSLIDELIIESVVANIDSFAGDVAVGNTFDVDVVLTSRVVEMGAIEVGVLDRLGDLLINLLDVLWLAPLPQFLQCHWVQVLQVEHGNGGRRHALWQEVLA